MLNNDLQTEVKRICNLSRNWSQWEDAIERWIKDIDNWENEDISSIDQSGTVIPTQIFESLSPNIQSICKDLGNYSAHKIWYNSTKQDIEPHILKYRAIIEELMYKAKLK